MDQPQRRRVTSVRQFEMMLEFLEDHRDLALGRIKSKEFRHTADRLWNQLAEELNSEGAHRSGKEWSKVWNDLKCKVRGKITTARVAQNGTGGGPYAEISLTDIENKVAAIIGFDVGPLANVMQNQLNPGDNGDDDEQNYLQEIVNEGVIDNDVNDNTSPQILDESLNEQDIEEEEVEEITTERRPRNESGILDPWAALRSYDQGHSPSRISRPPGVISPAIRARHERRSERRVRGTPQAAQSNRRENRENEYPRSSQSNRNCPLDWSREMMLRIEDSRAQAEQSNARSLGIIAEAIKMFAEAVSAATQLYLNNRNEGGA